MARVTSPVEGFTGDGPQGLRFEDGQAETDNPALIAYFKRKGFGIDDAEPVTPEDPEPPDPREHGTTLVGSALRDAAVDPRPEDFLPPTNAGRANPHGAQVVSPGIHAVSGPGPIVPGPVGRFERTEDGSEVVISDTDEQQRRETTAAEKVFLERRPVPQATAELGDQQLADDAKEPPAGNASQEAWADWVIATRPDLDEAEVRAMKRDELREQYGPRPE
ncbi:hypothetical protein DER29_4340 [Micromonospora sp. M71_S20]|uniref:hypothetical protein n=1 Tax=Micromonospora sp. M71_S20 TaxID=592872 RepID=UPI000EB08C3E|nr:hypothetical protein [Micromonospora sp. M71_S20]RLK13322.1 hypothetical protein DER29_4340 [Micromonospora sp. M71_S20]